MEIQLKVKMNTRNAEREAEWIPLMDYAMQYGVSLSTLRRHIKANKIPFKVEHGRYLLQAPQASSSTPAAAPAEPGPVAAPIAAKAPAQAPSSSSPPSPSPPAASRPGAGATSGASEVGELRLRLQRAQEEISELKMLVALYEEQIARQSAQASPGIHPRPNPLRMNG